MYGVCGLHTEEAEAARKKRSEERYTAKREAESAYWWRKQNRAKFLEACERAIREIAAGHNDPRRLAEEVLASDSDRNPDGRKPEGVPVSVAN